MRDRRDRRGNFQHPRKREAEPRKRETVDVGENTERDQWSEKARARLEKARKIGAGRNKHFFKVGRANDRAMADKQQYAGLGAEFNRSAREIDARLVRQG